MNGVIEITFDQYRVAKRVEQACGYLEIGLPQQAIDNVAGLEATGQLQGALQYVRGQALRMQSRYDDAVGPLEAAAKLLPEPAAQHVLEALEFCQDAMNRAGSTANSIASARGAKPAMP